MVGQEKHPLLPPWKREFAAGSGPHGGCSLIITERPPMLGIVLLTVLFLMLLGALPTWPHSRNWGYYPSGGLGLVLVILLVLLLIR
jgi:hypothetical protein